jgi:hypothetical protein
MTRRSCSAAILLWSCVALFGARVIAQIEALLLEDPLLLKTPIVRRGAAATLGYRPEVWALWK